MKMFLSFWGLTDLCLQRNLLFPQGPAQASFHWILCWQSAIQLALSGSILSSHLNGAEKQDSLLEDEHRART